MPNKKTSTISVKVKRNTKTADKKIVMDIKPMQQDVSAPDFEVHQLKQDDMPKFDNISQAEGKSGAVNFVVEKVDDSSEFDDAPYDDSYLEENVAPSYSKPQPVVEQEPKSIVKVKFSKFVNLVASRDFGDVIAANADEDVVISSNLLTELAGAQDRREEKKIPFVFIVGIAIGVVLAYIFFSSGK